MSHIQRILLLFALSTLSSLYGFSQSNPTCEDVAMKSQEELVQLPYSDNTRIREIVANWKSVCGNSEPIQRITILMDIREGKFKDTTSDDYITTTAYQTFISRVTYEADPDYRRIYEESKNYFGHSPLRSDLDSWTIELAKKNQRYTDPGTKQRAYCDFFAGDLNALEEVRDQYREKYVFNPEASVSFDLGAWMPVGKLADRFSQSVTFGLGIGGNLNPKYRLSGYLDYTILSKHPNFDVRIKQDTSSSNSDGILNVGVKFGRRFRPSNTFIIDASIGLGYCRMDTDVPRSVEDSTYYGINTVNIPLGITFSNKIKNGPLVGIYVGYNYAPFNIDDRLLNRFGQHSLVIKATVALTDIDD